MILPDVNVLLDAFRNDAPEHGRYHRWLESVVNGAEACGISPLVLCSMVRIAAHPRIYARPSRLEEALAFARLLQEQPVATVIQPGERHGSIFESLCGQSAVSGNLVQDAWFAALAIESGSEWITLDRDYARLPGLRRRFP